MQSSYLRSLVSYLAQHGVEAWCELSSGKLFAVSVYTFHGRVASQTVELTPTFAAVRSWLGY